jgi:hypothetical protein
MQPNDTASTTTASSSSSSCDQDSTAVTGEIAILEPPSTINDKKLANITRTTTHHVNADDTSCSQQQQQPDSWSSVLRDIVSNESNEIKSRHKALLFRPFANHDDTRLARLAEDCQAPSLEQCLILSSSTTAAIIGTIIINCYHGGHGLPAASLGFLPGRCPTATPRFAHPTQCRGWQANTRFGIGSLFLAPVQLSSPSVVEGK